jgi:hypothetical protein
MGEDLYLEPSRKAQIYFFLTIIFAALLYLSIDPLVNYLTPSPNASLEELKAGAQRLSFVNIGVDVIVFIATLYWALSFGKTGYRTLKFGTYPPPGEIVVWRTKIRAGKQAILQGYVLIFFAVISALITLVYGFILWLLIRQWILTL